MDGLYMRLETTNTVIKVVNLSAISSKDFILYKTRYKKLYAWHEGPLSS